MAQQTIGIGSTADDGTGDTFRAAFDKTNDNFDELYGFRDSIGNRIYVQDITDLPAAVGGVITLVTDTEYLQVSDINFGTTRISMGKSRYRGLGSNITTATYTGTSTFFTITGAATIDNLEIVCTTGEPINFNSSARFQWFDCVVTSCDTVGTFAGTAGADIRMDNVIFQDINTDGFTFTGAFETFSYTNSYEISIDNGDLFNLGTATFSLAFVLDRLSTTNLAAGTTWLRGTSSSANIGSGAKGSIRNCQIIGTGTTLAGVNESDTRWNISASDPIPDSIKAADTSLTTAETVTISVATTFVAIDGTNWVIDTDERFDGGVNGLLNYRGIESVKFLIAASVTFEKVGGGADEIEVAVSVNGVTTGPGFVKSGATSESATPSNVSSLRMVTLNRLDTVQLYVANNDSTANVIVDRANLNIIGGFDV